MDKEQFITAVAAAVPLTAWRALHNATVLLPYYHIVSDEDVPHVKHLYRFRNVAEFKQDLEFFLSQYDPVSLEAVIDHLSGDKKLTRKCFHLTFDDGFREMRDIVAPLLLERGIPATFFLCSGFVDNADMAHHPKLSLLVEHLNNQRNPELWRKAEALLQPESLPGATLAARVTAIPYVRRGLVEELSRVCQYDFEAYRKLKAPYLTTDQARWLVAQGFEIGAHSIDHPLYADQPLAEQLRQTRESASFLSQQFGVGCRSFAFPHKDDGVGREFYLELYQQGEMAVSFGTGGMVPHFWPRHLERFTMEKTANPARSILVRNLARGVYRSWQWGTRNRASVSVG